MYTERDEGRGLVRTCWSDIRSRVIKVEPTFARLVDEIDPDESFPLYLAYYPYGAIKGDGYSTLFPDCQGGYFRLTDDCAPQIVVDDLLYSKDTAPFGLLLEKNMEIFFEAQTGQSMPWKVYEPGSFLSFERTLKRESDPVFSPNGMLYVTSGARSVFLLPMIGCQTNHVNLQRDYHIKCPPPKSLYEHWNIFRQLSVSRLGNCDWRSCILYFSGSWVSHIHSDPRWMPLRMYIYEQAWRLFEYPRNKIYYDIAFSLIQKKCNLKPNPWLADMAKYLFTVAMGHVPGYAPACSDDLLPLNFLQSAFIESYGLKKYFPDILVPAQFRFDAEDNDSVYCSIKHLPEFFFSPKSRRAASALQETRELEHIVRIFARELSRVDGPCSDTITRKIAGQTDFSFFHNEMDHHGIMKNSIEIPADDKRFTKCNKNIINAEAEFAADAPFLRGCVRIQSKACSIGVPDIMLPASA